MTIDPTLYDWKLVSSYDEIFKIKGDISRELREVVRILTPRFPFEQERFVKDLILALDYDHEKPRTGAAFLAWAYEVEDARIKSRLEKLAKKHPDEPLLAITLKILSR